MNEGHGQLTPRSLVMMKRTFYNRAELISSEQTLAISNILISNWYYLQSLTSHCSRFGIRIPLLIRSNCEVFHLVDRLIEIFRTPRRNWLLFVYIFSVYSWYQNCLALNGSTPYPTCGIRCSEQLTRSSLPWWLRSSSVGLILTLLLYGWKCTICH